MDLQFIASVQIEVRPYSLEKPEVMRTVSRRSYELFALILTNSAHSDRYFQVFCVLGSLLHSQTVTDLSFRGHLIFVMHVNVRTVVLKVG